MWVDTYEIQVVRPRIRMASPFGIQNSGSDHVRRSPQEVSLIIRRRSYLIGSTVVVPILRGGEVKNISRGTGGGGPSGVVSVDIISRDTSSGRIKVRLRSVTECIK